MGDIENYVRWNCLNCTYHIFENGKRICYLDDDEIANMEICAEELCDYCGEVISDCLCDYCENCANLLEECECEICDDCGLYFVDCECDLCDSCGFICDDCKCDE